MSRFRLIPAQAHCARCKELFVYFRTTRPRVLCSPCIPLEAADSNKFYRDWRKVPQREDARAAHA